MGIYVIRYEHYWDGYGYFRVEAKDEADALRLANIYLNQTYLSLSRDERDIFRPVVVTYADVEDLTI